MTNNGHTTSASDHPWTPLIQKYSTIGPRYTSYPTALQFKENFSQEGFIRTIGALPNDHPISLYLHIPFCEDRCFYCACNKVVTKHKDRGVVYLQYLRTELGMYAELVGERPVKQILLGGGTPNFLTAEQLNKLISDIRNIFNVSPANELDLSIEIDPRYADDSYLEELQAAGFNRLSFGVQDLNPQVQAAVNRVCSKEHIEYLVESAREIGYSSIHMDLICGLPHQTPESFLETVAEIARLRPDRLSIFNYAHLPHRFPSQQRIRLEDLPSALDKLNILHNSIDYLRNSGYQYIGIDHFALDDSPLAIQQNNGTLHRSFQGYTTHGECALIGTGVSGISRTKTVYSQNCRTLEEYYGRLEKKELPIWRGYETHRDDRIRHALIMQLICHGKLDIAAFEKKWDIRFIDYFEKEYLCLIQQQDEGLLEITTQKLEVTTLGFLLIRNICMVFDTYISEFLPEKSRSRMI